MAFLVPKRVLVPIPMWWWGGFPHRHQVVLCDTSWVSYSLTQFLTLCLECQEVSPARLLSPHFRSQLQVHVCHLASNKWAINQRFPWPTGWFWFARASHRTQRNIYLHLPILLKNMIKDTDEYPDGKDARYMGKGTEPPCTLWPCYSLPASPRVHQPRSSLTCPSGFLWRLYYIGMLD